MKPQSLTGITILVGLTALAPVAEGQEWPQWRGPNRDGTGATFAAPAEWPEELTLRWSVPIGRGDSSPILVGDRLYLLARQGDDEVISAIDATEGTLLWQERYPVEFSSCLYNDHLGRYVNAGTLGMNGGAPKATPTFHDGRLYTFGVSGVFSALDARTGEVLWRKPAPVGQGAPMVGSAMSPLIDGDLAIVHLPGAQSAIRCPDFELSDQRGALVAYDAATGTERWRWEGDGAAYGSPLIATFDGTKQVVTITERHVVGLAPASGELLWKLPLQSPDDQNVVSPLLYQDTIIYGALENPVTAIRPLKRGDTWTTEKVWENRTHNLFLNTPVLVGDTAYGFSYRQKGQFFTLDARTGETLWAGPGRAAENAAIIYAGGVLFLLKNDGELMVARPTSTSFDVMRRYTVANSPTWAHPIIDGNWLYIKEAEVLNAWELP